MEIFVIWYLRKDWSYHNEIMHIPRQHSCPGLCKISLCPDWCERKYKKTYFTQIWNSVKILVVWCAPIHNFPLRTFRSANPDSGDHYLTPTLINYHRITLPRCCQDCLQGVEPTGITRIETKVRSESDYVVVLATNDQVKSLNIHNGKQWLL